VVCADSTHLNFALLEESWAGGVFVQLMAEVVGAVVTVHEK